jgi:hypothetical protein
MDFNEKVAGFISMVQHGCMSIMFNRPFAAWFHNSNEHSIRATYKLDQQFQQHSIHHVGSLCSNNSKVSCSSCKQQENSNMVYTANHTYIYEAEFSARNNDRVHFSSMVHGVYQHPNKMNNSTQQHGFSKQ